MRPIIERVSQLEEYSSYRIYKRQIRELQRKGAPKEVVESYRHRAAQHCFLAFAEVMVGSSLKIEPFHEIFASAFEDIANLRYHRLIISCPPRSGKSFISQLFLAWLIGRDDSSQHILSSYGKGLSANLFRGCLSYLKSPRFKDVFPTFRGFEEGTKSTLSGGGGVLVTSVGGESTGYTAGTPWEDSPGVGISLVDDPLKGSDSKAALRTLESWWAERISTRRTNRWGQVLIGTRFAVRDLHGFLMESDGLYDEVENPLGWRWINIEGLCERVSEDPLERNPGESHWPSNPIFTEEILEGQRRMMGNNRFSALYQGRPVSESGDLFQSRWISIEDKKPRADLVWFSLDTAFSEEEKADESVICVWGQTRPYLGEETDDNIYLLEVAHGRWNFVSLLENVRALIDYYKPKSIAIEKAASGQSLIQVLEREVRVPVVGYRPIKSKSLRLQQTLPLYEEGRVVWVKAIWNEDAREQMIQFPLHPHDDITDAISWGLIHYQEAIQGKNLTGTGDGGGFLLPAHPGGQKRPKLTEYPGRLKRDAISF